VQFAGEKQMKFGIFYEHQIPRPWDPNAEHRIYREALEQVELADRIGIDYAWEVEHHFLGEYSHSSAPEVFPAACSQRTKRIRLGHGIVLMPPGYNRPARVAERIAALDLVSDGRVEFGTGESASILELGGYRVDIAEKRAAWREPVEGGFDEEASPLGTKGLGELTAVSVAPAIANAVYHATGKRIRDLPVTVEKLL
jgi:hypothetical protein